MKILHTADWHLGKDWRGVSRTADLTEYVIPEIVNIALQKQVELVIVAGDILDGFGHESLKLCAELLRAPVKQLLDAGVHVAMIPGNHDNLSVFQLLEAALNINPLSSTAQLNIFTKPRSVNLNGVQIIGIPYLRANRFKNLLVKQGINLPIEPVLRNQTLSRQYEDVLKAAKAKWVNGNEPAVLIGHFSVSGASLKPEDDKDQSSYAGYETSYARDLKINREALLNSDQIPQYNALGHMHRGHPVPETVTPTYYSGAPDRFERGEEDYEPHVLLIDLPTEGKVEVEPIYLKQATPFIRTIISNRTELLTLKQQLNQNGERVLGDLVIKVNEDSDYIPLRDEAYEYFPRLKATNTVRRETSKSKAPIRFESTAEYAHITDPKTIFAEYFSSQKYMDKEIAHLNQTLDSIMKELDSEN